MAEGETAITLKNSFPIPQLSKGKKYHPGDQDRLKQQPNPSHPATQPPRRNQAWRNTEGDKGKKKDDDQSKNT